MCEYLIPTLSFGGKLLVYARSLYKSVSVSLVWSFNKSNSKYNDKALQKIIEVSKLNRYILMSLLDALIVING